METPFLDVPISKSVTYIAKLNKSPQEVFLYYSFTQNTTNFNHIQIQSLILYPYKGVPQTVHIY